MEYYLPQHEYLLIDKHTYKIIIYHIPRKYKLPNIRDTVLLLLILSPLSTDLFFLFYKIHLLTYLSL